ncbi:MAG: type VI secretion system ATPase TssH [Chitinivibrionales bacterium]|nr:type VI secretion system ATPase TssH [Chitinivibrionales bacterium]
MVVQDIRKLLERLNDHCQHALEGAVGYCVNRGHYELRWEHMLMQFLDMGQGDISHILSHFEIDASQVKKAVNEDLEGLKTGSTGKPAFSPPFLEVLELGWTLSSLNFGLSAVSSGALFIAAIEKGITAMSAYGTVLSKVNVEALKQDFFKIAGPSSEQQGAGVSAPKGAPGAAGAGEDVLNQYCTNFSQEAKDGKIDPILGRDEEIRQALDILNRRRKNNPILVGEAGVGKTAIVEGIALRIANGDVPEHLKNVDLWGLDLGLLQAGASVKGEFEKRLKNVIDAIKNSATPTILFIDEAHTLIGAGGSAGQGDAANLLKPALARGELRTMAATTWSEYRKYFEKDPALTRRFQLIKIEEPDEEKCSIMLRGIGASYEKHHGVRVTYDGIKSAVSMSHRYISGRQLPDKAVDVLDTACARVRMSHSTKPGPLDSAERALTNAELELKTLTKDRDAGIIPSDEPITECEQVIAAKKEEVAVLTDKWEKEKELAIKIMDLQEQCSSARVKDASSTESEKISQELEREAGKLEELQGETPMVFPYVSSTVCSQVVSDWTGIPIGSMLKDEAQTLLTLEDRLGQRVIGQDDALYELANTIRASKTGMGNPDAPLGVFLFAGPSGVGKTETAVALADTMFGGEKFMTVINMSEYQEKHTVSQLKGSPPGYVGYGEGGILTESVRQKPYSVVILDEVEKAHIEVMNLFYQVFDKGFMRDGEGREINFRNTIIIMTSNLAAETIVDMCMPEEPPEQEDAAAGGDKAEQPQEQPVSDEQPVEDEEEKTASHDEIIAAIRPTLSAHFQPAFLGRCKIVPFRPLDKERMRGIVALKLDKVAQRIYSNHGIQFSCSPALIDNIAANCTAVEAGARNADAVIDQTLLPAISRQLLARMGSDEKPYESIHVGDDGEGGFNIDFS